MTAVSGDGLSGVIIGENKENVRAVGDAFGDLRTMGAPGAQGDEEKSEQEVSAHDDLPVSPQRH